MPDDYDRLAAAGNPEWLGEGPPGVQSGSSATSTSGTWITTGDAGPITIRRYEGTN